MDPHFEQQTPIWHQSLHKMRHQIPIQVMNVTNELEARYCWSPMVEIGDEARNLGFIALSRPKRLHGSVNREHAVAKLSEVASITESAAAHI